jgi:hypothetical protein
MAKKQSTPKATPFRTVVQNLAFHNFEEQKILTAIYKDTVTLGDEDDPEKTFTANVMVDTDTGEEKYVQNSYSINKAIHKAHLEYKEQITDVVFQIEFLGKTMLKGKPFNQFKIGYCTVEEFESFKG